MSEIKRYVYALTLATLFLSGGAMANEGPGTLKARFIHLGELDKLPPAIGKLCALPYEVDLKISPVVVDVLVSLAGKAAESIIDLAAAKTQADATTLVTTIPLDGFFTETGGIAPAGGCLLFHNASSADLEDASILGAFRLIASKDSTAFRFQVATWRFARFLNPSTGHWFQKTGIRDLALKIEFLSPSSESLGTRSVFVEHVFKAVSDKDLGSAFISGQDLPWFLAPQSPGKLISETGIKRVLPLNIQITVVETTKPSQFATWMQDIAKEKKVSITDSIKDAVRKSLDENYAMASRSKLAAAAVAAFDEYKKAWDEATTIKTEKPKSIGDTADQVAKEKYQAEILVWKTKLTSKIISLSAARSAAQLAFANAEMSWPGDFPRILVD